MTHRIFLFSLIVTQSISIIAMDGQGPNLASQRTLKTPANSDEFLDNANATLESMRQMFGQLDSVIKKAQDDEVTPGLLAQYQAAAKKAQEKSRTAFTSYRHYLSPTNNTSEDNAKRLIQESFEKYKTEKDELTTVSNIIYNKFLAHQAHARVLIKHPESMSLCDTINKTKTIVESLESKLEEDRREALFLDDLLLSTAIKSLHDTLESVKKQAESK